MCNAQNYAVHFIDTESFIREVILFDWLLYFME